MTNRNCLKIISWKKKRKLVTGLTPGHHIACEWSASRLWRFIRRRIILVSTGEQCRGDAGGSVVVKELEYKIEGRGFETR
jgi:hypothetical protein